MSIKELVGDELSILRGKPFWASGRSADLQWFQFGKRHQTTTRTGILKEVGEYALHVQCAWRIRSAQKIIVASQDRYYSKKGTNSDNDEFDWQVFGTTLCDAQMNTFVDKYCPLKINLILADEVGGVSLIFEQGFSLEIYPDSSLKNEHWRLFSPGTDTPHLVLEGNELKRW